MDGNNLLGILDVLDAVGGLALLISAGALWLPRPQRSRERGSAPYLPRGSIIETVVPHDHEHHFDTHVQGDLYWHCSEPGCWARGPRIPGARLKADETDG